MNASLYFKGLVMSGLLATSAWAAPTIYVNAATGSDANPGTSAGAPVQTITQGILNVDADGTVIVAAGQYNEAVTLDKKVALLGANSGVDPNTMVRGAETIMTAAAPMVTFAAGSAGSKLDGFKLTGAANDAVDGVIKGSANDVIVANVIVDGNSAHGMNLTGVQGWTVEKNLVQNITGTSRSGLFLITFQNSIVRDNVIKNSVYAGIICDSVQNLTVQGNTVQNATQPGIQVANSAGPVTISGNTFTACNTSNSADKAAISIYPNSPVVTVTGNTLSGNSGAFSVRNQAGTVAATVTVNYNDIIGNTAPAIRNRAQGGGALDATNNWWGVATGPAAGDLAEANVTFSPWLAAPASVADWSMY